jgi:hypothetical protein
MADLELDSSKCYQRINHPKDKGVPFYLGKFQKTEYFSGGNKESQWAEHEFEKGKVYQVRERLINLLSVTDCLANGGKRNRKLRKTLRKRRHYSRKN